jgi:hypothetical protein
MQGTFLDDNVTERTRIFDHTKLNEDLDNMWDKKRIFNCSLDKLLSPLLSLRLWTKKRDHQDQEYQH